MNHSISSYLSFPLSDIVYFITNTVVLLFLSFRPPGLATRISRRSFLFFFYPRSVCCVSHCVYTASFCVRVFPSNSHADVVTTNIFAPRERKRERESERKKCSGFALSFSRCLFIRAIGRRRFLASPGRLSPSGRKYLLLSLTFVVCIYSVVSHFGDYGKLSLPLSSTSFSSFSLASGLSFP